MKCGSQFLALQKLTRHRFHLVDTLVSEKNWMLSNIYLKFSELDVNNKKIETVDRAIEKTVKGLNPTQYQSLISVKGIGPVISSGIISEIGTIAFFPSHDSLAKFAGLTWRKHQSGNYSLFLLKNSLNASIFSFGISFTLE
ncbi:MAG: Uncharacterized protein XD96_0707 [Petrotoga mobilis]|nr:MAG: Uncharacterized protein XD96_0707 [Petrotoga mobilis]